MFSSSLARHLKSLSFNLIPHQALGILQILRKLEKRKHKIFKELKHKIFPSRPAGEAGQHSLSQYVSRVTQCESICVKSNTITANLSVGTWRDSVTDQFSQFKSKIF